MISRENKQEKIDRLSARLEGANVVVVAENTGLSASDMVNFRQKFSESGDSVQVVKNTLARIVLKESDFSTISDKLNGPLIYGIGKDAALIAKNFVDTAKDNPKLVIRGGVLSGGMLMDIDGVNRLATLPSRDELLSKLLGTMQAPIAGFVRTLNAIPTGVVRALAEIRDKKE